MSLKNISLKEVINSACNDLFPMFSLYPQFLHEITEDDFNSPEKFNVIVGLLVGLKGNIILSFPEEAAKKLVSGMMGGAQITKIDEIGQSAMSEFSNMLIGNALTKFDSDPLIDISPPVIIVGNEKLILSNDAVVKKMCFKLEETTFNITYHICS